MEYANILILQRFTTLKLIILMSIGQGKIMGVKTIRVEHKMNPVEDDAVKLADRFHPLHGADHLATSWTKCVQQVFIQSSHLNEK